MSKLKYIINCILPQWKTISFEPAVFEHTSVLLGKTWETHDVIEIQENANGKKRAFIVTEYGRKKIDYDYIMAMIAANT